MSCRIRFLVLVSLLCGSPAFGEDTEGRFGAETRFIFKRVEMGAIGRVHAAESRGGWYQLFGGPTLGVQVTPRVMAIGGYYFTRTGFDRLDHLNTHRLFGGSEISFHRFAKAELGTRVLAEQYWGPGASNPNRYRARLNLAATTPRVAPYTSFEYLAGNRGWLSYRFAGGLRWRWNPDLQLDFSYFYEPRRIGDRHVITTLIRIRGNGRHSSDH